MARCATPTLRLMLSNKMAFVEARGKIVNTDNQSLNLTGKIVRFYVEGCASSKVIRPAG